MARQVKLAVVAAFAIGIATMAVVGYLLRGNSQAPDAEAWIGPEGGVLTVKKPNSALKGVAVEVPKGALDQRKKISITGARLVSKGKAPASSPAVVQGFELGPKGTTFAKPAVVHVPYVDRDHNGVIDSEGAPVQFFQFVLIDAKSQQLLPLVTNLDRQNLVVSMPINLIPAARIFLLQPQPFKRGLVVKYAIRALPAGLANDAARAAIANAFKSWLAIAGDVNISFEETTGPPDIEIRLGGRFPFGLRDSVFGRTGYSEYTSYSWLDTQRTIWLQDAAVYDAGQSAALKPGLFDLESVLLHQIGHALGLPDRADCTQGPPVMCPAPKQAQGGAMAPQRELALEDMNEFLALYGLDPRKPIAPPPMVKGSWLSPQPEATVEGVVHTVAYFPAAANATGVSRVDFLVWRDNGWSVGCSQPTPQAASPGITSYECDVSLGGMVEPRIGLCFNTFYGSGDIANCGDGQRFVNKVMPVVEPPNRKNCQAIAEDAANGGSYLSDAERQWFRDNKCPPYSPPLAGRRTTPPTPTPRGARPPVVISPPEVLSSNITIAPPPPPAQVNYNFTSSIDGSVFSPGQSMRFCYHLSPEDVPYFMRLTYAVGSGSFTTVKEVNDDGRNGGDCFYIDIDAGAQSGSRTFRAEASIGGSRIGQSTNVVRVVANPTSQTNTLPPTTQQTLPTTTRLGGLSNLDGYCRAKYGSTYKASSSGTSWYCGPTTTVTNTLGTVSFVPINFDDACKWTYPNATSPWGKVEGGGWVCYSGPK